MKNISLMKSRFYTRLSVVAAVALLAACSAATNDNDKKARLEKLKSQHSDLSKEIQKLEEEIAKENPDAATKVKAKEIEVTELTAKPFDHYVQTQGRVESENNVTVGAKMPGVITQVYVQVRCIDNTKRGESGCSILTDSGCNFIYSTCNRGFDASHFVLLIQRVQLLFKAFLVCFCLKVLNFCSDLLVPQIFLAVIN